MTLPTEDVAALVARLASAIALGDATGARGKHPSNIYNLANEAATALSTLAGERDEAWDIIEKERGTVAMLSADAGAWHRRATTAEAQVVALREALDALIDATRAYLPPDGISKDDLINRVLAATDNPKINAFMMGGRNGAL